MNLCFIPCFQFYAQKFPDSDERCIIFYIRLISWLWLCEEIKKKSFTKKKQEKTHSFLVGLKKNFICSCTRINLNLFFLLYSISLLLFPLFFFWIQFKLWFFFCFLLVFLLFYLAHNNCERKKNREKKVSFYLFSDVLTSNCPRLSKYSFENNSHERSFILFHFIIHSDTINVFFSLFFVQRLDNSSGNQSNYLSIKKRSFILMAIKKEENYLWWANINCL